MTLIRANKLAVDMTSVQHGLMFAAAIPQSLKLEQAP